MYLKILISFCGCLFLTLLVMPVLIPYLHKIKYGQAISEYSLDDFKKKAGTPTMGGLAFVLIPVLVLFALFPSFYQDLDVLMLVLAFIGYGLIGFIDDYIIVVKKDNHGLSPLCKFTLQLVLSIVFYFLYQKHSITSVTFPFTGWVLELGWLYAVLVFFMFTGASNAVNLTDGMDGLAGGTSLLALSPFVLFALQQGKYMVAVFVMGVIGALLGYLRYNLHPAKIFMGDTGSLALGGLLAGLGLVLKQEIALVIIGGVFVYETLCVIIQIGSVKLRHKKVFRYTPIHYSFELNGLKETQVVVLFWILGLVCAVIGFVIGVFA